MLGYAMRMTENLVVLSLLAASAATMQLAWRRDRRVRGHLDSAYPSGITE